MKFNNMKIEINQDQPLDEVVMELERIGCVECKWGRASIAKYIYVFIDGVFKIDINNQPAFDHIPFTTLAELKEMK